MLDTIEAAIADIKKGKMIVVVDDENRENEGDLICAAECITPEMVTFMVREACGYLCCAIDEDRCNDLDLNLMVGEHRNTDPNKTAFMVTVDLDGNGCTTGISATDRAKTLNALAHPDTLPHHLRRPGHINPLKARNGGVLRRAGHTEAALDFARLAGYQPAGVLIEIMNEKGEMARLPELRVFADKHDLKLVSIEQLINYRLQHDSLITHEIDVNMPTELGDFTLTAFRQNDTKQLHLALTKGTWDKNEPVMVRVHSSCVTGDIFGSCRCDCGTQLQQAMQMIQAEGKGAIIYMNQEGRGIGLLSKLKAYKLQEQGLDTVQANIQLGYAPDERDYGVGAQMLRHLGIHKMRLISNNPKKRVGLMGYGLEITEKIPIHTTPNQHNHQYLLTKKEKMGHEIDIQRQ
jgi:3,4-dihydroxy 2-butanone 4-phosphate synthase/GTP cyclohydrolase II